MGVSRKEISYFCDSDTVIGCTLSSPQSDEPGLAKVTPLERTKLANIITNFFILIPLYFGKKMTVSLQILYLSVLKMCSLIFFNNNLTSNNQVNNYVFMGCM